MMTMQLIHLLFKLILLIKLLKKSQQQKRLKQLRHQPQKLQLLMLQPKKLQLRHKTQHKQMLLQQRQPQQRQPQQKEKQLKPLLMELLQSIRIFLKLLLTPVMTMLKVLVWSSQLFKLRWRRTWKRLRIKESNNASPSRCKETTQVLNSKVWWMQEIPCTEWPLSLPGQSWTR